MKKIHALVLGASVVLLAACGSSSDDSTPVTPAPVANATDIPSSAQNSSSGFVDYVMSLLGTSSETAEPVVLGDVVPPVDNTTETSL